MCCAIRFFVVSLQAKIDTCRTRTLHKHELIWKPYLQHREN